MGIKRLSLEELRARCSEVFYDYMVNGTTFYDKRNLGGTTFINIPAGKTPVDMLWEETQDSIKENEERIKLIQAEITRNKDNEAVQKVLMDQLHFLEKEGDLFKSSNMKTQKEFYAKSGIVEYSRSVVRIPLDKIINSYYDDLTLEVVFYDDLGVANGKYEDYKALSSKEDKLIMIKECTEVTHMGLVVLGSDGATRALIALQGELKEESENSAIELLSSEYADFENLPLAKTMEVYNNDLKQLLQSKIDLDKENLTVLADKNVGSDNYKILHYYKEGTSGGGTYYIRYICPSTGRVYYNDLNLTNLAYSNYFNKEDYSTYIDAWWSLNNLGASIEEAENFIRC